MRKRLNKILTTCAGVFFVAVVLALLSYTPGLASEIKETSFQTENEVTDAADGYFILRDTTTKRYGLYDSNGKCVIACEYDAMQFPEDTISYDYLVVKQGSNWGILDYSGNPIIDVKYNSVSPYVDGLKVATAYNGDKTEIFNDKGVQIGSLSGEYVAISDEVFKGATDLRTRKDSAILSLENQKLLFTRKNTSVQVANVYKLGSYIAADYNASASSKEEVYGKMNTYRYIKVFNTKAKVIQNITPDPSWTEEEDEEVTGGIRVEKVISDHSLIVRLLGYKENYLAIYDLDTGEYSDLFLNIGDFYDDEAFAADEDGTLYIINTSGDKAAENEVTVTSYERLGITKSKHDPFMIFKKTDEDDSAIYKLYCLNKHMALEETFTTVTFRRNEDNAEICHGFPLVSNDKKEYTILNKDGEPIFDYGKYDKDTLVNHILYSDTNITVVQENGDINEVSSYTVAESRQISVFERIMEHELLVEIVGLILLLVILLLLIRVLLKRRKDREAEERSNPVLESEEVETQKTEILPDTKLEEEIDWGINFPKKFSGQINCLTGEYAGAKIELQESEWIRIGRDESENDLVLVKGTISRKHCAVHYDTYQKTYYVIDYSRNGVMLENGSRLPQQVEVEVKPGSKIYLGDNQTIIELAIDPSI